MVVGPSKEGDGWRLGGDGDRDDCGAGRKQEDESDGLLSARMGNPVGSM